MVQQSWKRYGTFKTLQRGQNIINFLLLILETEGGEEKGKTKKKAGNFIYFARFVVMWKTIIKSF